MICRFPSLETRWLQRSEKWMTQPMVAFMDHDCSVGIEGAIYCSQRPEAVMVDGTEIWLGDAGLLILKSEREPSVSSEIELAADIAHEWRHCWQQQSGFKFDSNVNILNRNLPYETVVGQYFRASKCEADALWFEYERTHSPMAAYWMDLTRGA